ncbi:MAG: hypothetical protein V7735_06820 [Photobacterium frigidiphilum]|uniref:hypothetical protein n=1 Tax=Photobacterium frigidiphilum TaxID=264736 RepID=UPI0030017841
MRYFYILFIILFLTGCGESNGKNNTSIDEQLTSSLLSTQSAPINGQFSNFENKPFSIDPQSFNFDGNNVYLKVYDTDGNVLYLGGINKGVLFSIELASPKNDSTVIYDLFTDSANDLSISGEFVL